MASTNALLDGSDLQLLGVVLTDDAIVAAPDGGERRRQNVISPYGPLKRAVSPSRCSRSPP